MEDTKKITDQFNNFFPSVISTIIKEYLLILKYKYEFDIKISKNESILCMDCFDNKLYVIKQKLNLEFPMSYPQPIYCIVYDMKTHKKLHKTIIAKTDMGFRTARILHWNKKFMWIYVDVCLIKYNHNTRKYIKKIRYYGPVLNNIFVINKNLIGRFESIAYNLALMLDEKGNTIKKKNLKRFKLICGITGKKKYDDKYEICKNDTDHKLCISSWHNDEYIECHRESYYAYRILKMIYISKNKFKVIHEASPILSVSHKGIEMNFEPFNNKPGSWDNYKTSIDKNIVFDEFNKKYYMWHKDRYLKVDHCDSELLLNKSTINITCKVNKDKSDDRLKDYIANGPATISIYSRVT